MLFRSGAMHFVSEDHCLLELVDPKDRTPIPLAEGAIGEMVFTFLDWRGGPFMRYALGDSLQVWTSPCVCGKPGIRFKILGRSDDMLTVKGVNVYPQAIAAVIARFRPQLTGAFRIRLDHPGPQVRPPLRLRVEHAGLETSDLAALEAVPGVIGVLVVGAEHGVDHEVGGDAHVGGRGLHRGER